MALMLDWYRNPVQLGSADQLREVDFVESLLQISKEGKLSEETAKGLTSVSPSLNLRLISSLFHKCPDEFPFHVAVFH